MDAKYHLANELATYLKNNQCIGVGTGTTVEAVLGKLRERIQQESLQITFVPTSFQSGWKLEELGLNVSSPLTAAKLDWAFDGADEVDDTCRLIKGRGAAMLHEKLVAMRTDNFIVVVDEGKFVKRLGEKSPVPIEVIPAAIFDVKERLQKLGARETTLRMCTALERTSPMFTQEGNLILDAVFDNIGDSLESEINLLPGVVENGIFTNQASRVLVASESRVRTLTPKR